MIGIANGPKACKDGSSVAIHEIIVTFAQPNHRSGSIPVDLRHMSYL